MDGSLLLMDKTLLYKLGSLKKSWDKKSTLPKTNMSPENGPSQKETSLPTIHFRGYVSFREGINCCRNSVINRINSILQYTAKSLYITWRLSRIMKSSLLNLCPCLNFYLTDLPTSPLLNQCHVSEQFSLIPSPELRSLFKGFLCC